MFRYCCALCCGVWNFQIDYEKESFSVIDGLCILIYGLVSSLILFNAFDFYKRITNNKMLFLFM